MTRQIWVPVALGIRPARTLQQIALDLRGAHRVTEDWRSFARYAADVIYHRLLRIVEVGSYNLERRIRLQGAIDVVYRRNRGDIYTIREVWIDRVYEPPAGYLPDVLVDLGAHIGLTSLWFAKTYSPSIIVAVEPIASNAALARWNLASNGVAAQLIEAAVGDRETVVRMQESRDSNRSQVRSEGVEVPMVTMPRILERIPADRQIDLLKVDIEGGECAVLGGDLSWLKRVQMIIGEFHSSGSDRCTMFENLYRAGFRSVRLQGGTRKGTECFVRRDISLEAR